MDFMVLIIMSIMATGFTFYSLTNNQRFVPSFISGIIWIALALVVLETNMIFFGCCIALGLYMMIRSVYE